MPSVTLLAPSLTSTLLKWLFPRDQWCIAKNGGGGYTQMAVENGLKVPCLFMITEVSILCQKNLEVAIQRIPPPIHHCQRL